ncbi:GspH/FimT family pseudopilin [Thiolapillus sp.]
MNKQRGFTLVELLMTLVVLSILMALAIPSFQKMMDRNAVTTTANDLLSSILLARSESVKQEKRVVVRRGSSWSEQFYVFADENNNNTYEAATDGPLIVDYRKNNPTVTISGNGTAANFIRFNSRGRATLSPGNDFFTINRNNETRYVCFSPTGRPRIQENSCS